jgi:hypothetical protein
VQHVEDGCFAAALSSEHAADVVAPHIPPESSPEDYFAAVQQAVADQLRHAQQGDEHAVRILTVAVAALYVFLQANVTGYGFGRGRVPGAFELLHFLSCAGLCLKVSEMRQQASQMHS